MVRYLHPADHHSARIRKVDRLFGDELDFKDIKFPVKVKDNHKTEKNNSIGNSIFGYKNKVKCPISVSKNALKKNMLTHY